MWRANLLQLVIQPCGEALGNVQEYEVRAEMARQLRHVRQQTLVRGRVIEGDEDFAVHGEVRSGAAPNPVRDGTGQRRLVDSVRCQGHRRPQQRRRAGIGQRGRHIVGGPGPTQPECRGRDGGGMSTYPPRKLCITRRSIVGVG